MHLKISSAKWRPLCLGLNVLITDAFPIAPDYGDKYLKYMDNL